MHAHACQLFTTDDIDRESIACSCLETTETERGMCYQCDCRDGRPCGMSLMCLLRGNVDSCENVLQRRYSCTSVDTCEEDDDEEGMYDLKTC